MHLSVHLEGTKEEWEGRGREEKGRKGKGEARREMKERAENHRKEEGRLERRLPASPHWEPCIELHQAPHFQKP